MLGHVIGWPNLVPRLISISHKGTQMSDSNIDTRIRAFLFATGAETD